MNNQALISDKIFYHGTNAVFTNFDISMKGSNTEWSNTVHGFFFADKIENALLFGERIIKARLSLKNPIDLRLESIFSIQSQASTIWEILTGEILSNEEALDTLNEEISLGELGDLWDALETEDANAILVEKGYDGIISSLGNDQIEYIVFTVDQIEQLTT